MADSRVCEMCQRPFTPRGTRGPKPRWCRACVALRTRDAWRKHQGFIPAEERSCIDCGSNIGRAKRRFCDACSVGKDRRRKAVRRGVERASAESFRDIEIFERDGWVCGLCGEDVPREWVSRSPGSPSLDHILPISLGGEHSRANVQLAHLRCNVVKGNRPFGEQLRLV